MNCKKINEQVSIVEYLAQNGRFPKKTKLKEFWYFSPFREEKTPSFKVDSEINRFYDFGEGSGGTLVDLIIRLEKISIPEIIQKFSEGSFSFHEQTIEFSGFACQKKKEYEILQLKVISSFPLLQYLEDRKLSLEIVKEYCKEIHYQLNQKTYYAIAFPNKSNGFEIRNKYVKMCLVKKDISWIKNDRVEVKVFESWSDFISYLFLFPGDQFAFDFMILNSISLLKRNLDLLKKYIAIEIYLDNDQAEISATNFLKNELGTKVINRASLYHGCKDLNEFIQKTNLK